MAQPQPQVPHMAHMPARSFSPQQPSPSPGHPTHEGFALPATKRARTSPNPPSQPASPFSSATYGLSPASVATPPPSATSPAYPPPLPVPLPQQPQQQQLLQQQQHQQQLQNHQQQLQQQQQQPLQQPIQIHPTPYTNGNGAPMLYLPESRPSFNAPATTPGTPYASAAPTPSPQYTTATMAPIGLVPATPGVMGPPPPKAPERQAKEPDFDPSDVLAGINIDLRAEEQNLDTYMGGWSIESRTGFAEGVPGGKDSMHGAGTANQEVWVTGPDGQRKFAISESRRTWESAARRMAMSRNTEITSGFLRASNVHARIESITREHGLKVNKELKTPAVYGRLKSDAEFPKPEVTVRFREAADGMMVNTYGSWIPHDAHLVDSLALLSLATKHRIRELLEDAQNIATLRQTTSHGQIPAEWDDIAAPVKTAAAAAAMGDGVVESLVMSPASENPLKRSFDAANPPPRPVPISTNHMASAMREAGKRERKLEEERLRKRQKRLNPEMASTSGTAAGAQGAVSRAGSVAPGTPGGQGLTASESGGGGGMAVEKPITKKELKKSQGALRTQMEGTTAAANATLNSFMFSRKKKNKQYSWMTQGSASGTSTPRHASGGAGGQAGAQPGTPAAPGAAMTAPENITLTQEGRNRLGAWREGTGIQMRDWITALEMDGTETRILQHAYLQLDGA